MQNKEQNQLAEGVPIAEPEEPPVETLPSNCSVNIRGWENDNEAEAREFGRVVMSLAKELSRYLDLSRLESIIVGWDYAEALVSVDRGDGIPPAAPTANEYGLGGAMALHMVRNDEIWSVVVIWTGLVRQLNHTDHPEHKLALQPLSMSWLTFTICGYLLEPIPAVGEQQNPGMGETPTFSRS